ncbi:MAG: SRPBCC family protein [Pseudomonadota bacterium]
MAKVAVTTTVKAPLEQVWASWDDFGNIYRFNPNLKGSYLLPGSQPTGPGARRQCDLADGKNYIREKIIGYQDQKEMVIDIYEGTMPLKSAVAILSFRSTGSDQTVVTMEMDFKPKFGPIGALMVPMMKPKFRQMLQALLDANAAYVENGKTAGLAA